jgi:omega-hydroxy-beta-dihydromenaquinone-9 sulfotransferase
MSKALKHRWSVANNYLAGITLDRWFELLHENSVSPTYWHRAAFITATACLNSIAYRKEKQLEETIRNTPLAGPPLFILGHWRSGTTHLHNLLSLDTQNFAFANTYQVTNPLTFLTTEETNTRLFARLVPKKRLMDNMAMGFELPQEDEFAPCLDTLKSSYLGISFPDRQAYYDRYLTFDGVPKDEIKNWGDSLITFCKKLTYKYQRPLLLKSPSHTARIKHLLDWFPDARFVHIHRHPHQVFRSNQHYWDTAVWYTYLQKPDRSKLDLEILQRYRMLHDAFHAQRSLIPEGRFHEISFNELEANPLSTIETIYQKLDLPRFESFKPTLETYLTAQSSYRKNQFTPLPKEIIEMVNHYTAPELKLWNYSPNP